MYDDILKILYLIGAFCLWILLTAIILNFFFSKKEKVKREKKSVVETGSMLAFFLVMFILVYLKFGVIEIDELINLIISIFGTIFIIIGTIINVFGRLKLKSNWGNQIKIYENHTLTTTGIYKYIRHPLYSSTILMLYGFSLLFINPVVFILNSILFLPFMIHRARLEDEMLLLTFKDTYSEYKSKTGLFIPKFRRK
ncbi:MAG: hypothetical protein A2Y15_03185 [Clostridiales bacterium GWF2_36_10]|nr:MAG: hypothetical protein A2Y15_03185 [Clostridiales bacterium GWF2_36_10]HAN20976.1 hypothetical protein [Clostridiales bacterium]